MENAVFTQVPNPANLLGDALRVVDPIHDKQALQRAKAKIEAMSAPLGEVGFARVFKPYLTTLPKGDIVASVNQYVAAMAKAFHSRCLATVVAGIESYIKNGGKFWPSIGDLMQAFDEQDERLNAMANAVDKAIENGPTKRLGPARREVPKVDTSGLGPEFDADGKPNWFVGRSGKIYQVSNHVKAQVA